MDCNLPPIEASDHHTTIGKEDRSHQTYGEINELKRGIGQLYLRGPQRLWMLLACIALIRINFCANGFTGRDILSSPELSPLS